MIKGVIIEDDKRTEQLLKTLIEEHTKGLAIIDTVGSVIEGVKTINKFKPDVIFLNISLPDATGFDLLDCFTDRTFRTIIISENKSYAYKSLKYGAFDFIVKPFEICEVTKTLFKLVHIDKSKFDFLSIRLSDCVKHIEQNSIQYIKASGSYSEVSIKDQNKILVSQNLSQIERQLCPSRFVRTHRSWIINTQYVKEINPNFNELNIRSNTIPISKTYRNNLKNKFVHKT